MIQHSEKPLIAAMATSCTGTNCESYLLARYGATMSLRNLATELGSTPNALRIRQLRCGDLPPRIPGVRGYRWPTTTVAAWISKFGGELNSPADEIATTHGSAKPRGRPRRCQSSNSNDVWGAA
jgi:hypothetical protein